MEDKDDATERKIQFSQCRSSWQPYHVMLHDNIYDPDLAFAHVIVSKKTDTGLEEATRLRIKLKAPPKPPTPPPTPESVGDQLLNKANKLGKMGKKIHYYFCLFVIFVLYCISTLRNSWEATLKNLTYSSNLTLRLLPVYINNAYFRYTLTTPTSGIH